MKRVSIAEIIAETGLSRATIDRILNGRGKVHDRTRKVVEDTLRKLQRPDEYKALSRPKADIILRLGQGMMQQLRHAWDKANVEGQFHDMYQAIENEVVFAAAKACENLQQPLIITAMNSERLTDLLANARRRGKRIISLVSDLAPDARDIHVGIDNRAAGQTAAFLIGRMLGDRPTSVGVVVGDAAFRCHEDREMGFRSGLRMHFPKVIVAGEARGGDSGALTAQAVTKLLGDQPALNAIYNVGGGNAGVAEALARSGRSKDIMVIGHEVNSVTTPLLRNAIMDFVMATNPASLLDAALQQLKTNPDASRDTVLLDFEIYSRFNLPSFAPHADSS